MADIQTHGNRDMLKDPSLTQVRLQDSSSLFSLQLLLPRREPELVLPKRREAELVLPKRREPESRSSQYTDSSHL